LPSELFQVLGSDKERVVVVYQHVRAKKVRERLEVVLEVVRKDNGRFSCTSYESGTVAFLFVSRSHNRIAKIRDCFLQFLGTHAKNRIGYGNGHAV